jgi:lipoprotein-releasing system ATP-binding protein
VLQSLLAQSRTAFARYALGGAPPQSTSAYVLSSFRAGLKILESVVRERGKTVVADTHDLGMAARMDRRIQLVDGRIG